jgi:sec-independent protein translocase protein TatC
MVTITYFFSEIRIRVVYILIAWITVFLLSYCFKLELMYFVSRPFLQFQNKFIFLDLTEAFYTTIQVCIMMSCLCLVPYCLYHFWSFIIPGKYVFERLQLFRVYVVFIVLLCIQILCIYTLLFPILCEFLISFEIKTVHSAVTLELSARIHSYLRLVAHFFITCVFFFQIPFFFVVLYSKTQLTSFHLCTNRKFFFFIAVLISAFFSPPDFISQCFFSLIFFILYEFLIFLGFFFL